MTNETAAKAEGTAQMIATAVRLSQILNITFDDAVRRWSSGFSAAIRAAEASRKYLAIDPLYKGRGEGSK